MQPTRLAGMKRTRINLFQAYKCTHIHIKRKLGREEEEGMKRGRREIQKTHSKIEKRINNIPLTLHSAEPKNKAFRDSFENPQVFNGKCLFIHDGCNSLLFHVFYFVFHFFSPIITWFNSTFSPLVFTNLTLDSTCALIFKFCLQTAIVHKGRVFPTICDSINYIIVFSLVALNHSLNRAACNAFHSIHSLSLLLCPIRFNSMGNIEHRNTIVHSRNANV